MGVSLTEVRIFLVTERDRNGPHLLESALTKAPPSIGPSATWRASDVAIYAVEQCSEDHRPFFANLNHGETEDVAKSA